MKSQNPLPPLKVFVYFNLHKKVFSVKALEGENKGRVIAHMDKVVLSGAMGKVSQAGRNRVLAEKRKNVHAGIVGWLTTETPVGHARKVTYNPYRFKTFVYKDDESEYEWSKFAVLDATDRSVTAYHKI